MCTIRDSESRYQDVYEFRLAIEIWAAGKAAERISDREADKLKGIVSSMKTHVAQGLPLTDLDAAFHLAIAKASHNSVYYHVSNTVFHLISDVTRQSHEYLFLSAKDQEVLLVDHEGICEAIISHDTETARIRMQSHLGRVAKNYQKK